MKLKSVILIVLLFIGNVVFAEETKKYETITLTCPMASTPFSYFDDDDGQVKGSSIDLWRLWSEKTGIKIRLIPKIFQPAIDMVCSGEADAYAHYTRPDGQESCLTEVITLRNEYAYYFYHRGISVIKSTQDLKGFKIGVIKGTAPEEYLRKHLPDAVPAVYPGGRAMFDALSKKEIFIFLHQLQPALWLLKKYGLEQNFRFDTQMPLYTSTLSAAVKKGNTGLAEVIRQGMNLITADERASIERKWNITPVKTEDTLVISAPINIPPFMFLNTEGSPVGMFADIWKLWAQKTGRKIGFLQADTRKTGIEYVKTGRADIQGGLFYNSEEYEGMSFPPSFYEAGASIFFPLKYGKVSGIAELSGQSVGAVRGTYQERYLKKSHPDIRVAEFDSGEEMIYAARDGKIRGFISLSALAAYDMSRLGLSGEFGSLPGSLYTGRFSSGVLKENTELMAAVDKGFDLISNRELAEIEARWIPDPEKQYYKSRLNKIRLSAAEDSWLKNHRTLRVGVGTAFPPFQYMENGEFKGIASDYIDILTKRLGIRMEIVKNVSSFQQVLEMAEKREIDVLACVSETPERKKYMNFTQPYLSFPLVIITANDAPFIRGLADLNQKKVAFAEFLADHSRVKDNFPDIIPYFVRTPPEKIEAVSLGKAEACIENIATASYLIQKNNLANLKIAAPSGLPNTEIAFASRNDWSLLNNILNKALESVTKEEQDAIYKKWVPVRFEYKADWSEILKWLISVGSVFVIIMGITLFWNRKLSKEISVRKQIEKALQKAKEAAEAANRAKSEFLANMSHELRTPLNATIGFAQVMARSQTLPPEHQENVSIIRRSGEHLLTLINQVLELSKIEAGRTTLNETVFDLYQLLDESEDLFLLRVKEKNLRLMFDRSPDLPQYIRSDEVKLRQILINLLNNAIKFTQEGGVAVRVQSSKCRMQNDKYGRIIIRPFSLCTLHFALEDTGPGISPDELEGVFKAFVQTSGGRAQEGTGLGLAISRKFVQMMGGDITVQSEPGKGSLFKFDIQVEIADAGSVNIKQSARHIIALQPGQIVWRILIVDDRPDNRRLLVKLLAPLGFDIREAENGQEAVEISESYEPHLIWMDMRMPVMDGYEATKRIRSTIKGQSVAIIALTASAFEEERSVVLSAGCDDFLRKPFREHELFDMMKKHLGVCYIYEKDENLPDSEQIKEENRKALTAEAVSALPPGIVKDLENAAIRGNMDAISAVIEAIRVSNAPLADALTDLADGFQYAEILNLTPQPPSLKGKGEF